MEAIKQDSRDMKSEMTEQTAEKKKRDIVIPGETIVTGSEYLPGDCTARDGEDIVAIRFGLSDITDRFVKVIPLAGVYIPRKGNSIICKVTDITFNGWIMDINSPYMGFLQVMECSKFVNKNDLTEYLDFGDMVVAEVYAIKHRGVDLTLRARGLGKLEDGMIISINPNKVPRVIGREGSMINLIKHETGCNITVGQNGLVWIKGRTVESELFAKEAIMLIVEKSFVDGLTEKVEEFLEKNRKKFGNSVKSEEKGK
ncbi:KH domain-containing protein [Candidatus Pacearchaeota archaeon]|nr:KH domain-containing protein [Candidatus Pacearchaeota archaeon]